MSTPTGFRDAHAKLVAGRLVRGGDRRRARRQRPARGAERRLRGDGLLGQPGLRDLSAADRRARPTRSAPTPRPSRSTRYVPRLATRRVERHDVPDRGPGRHRPGPADHARRARRRRRLPDHGHQDLHHRRRARPDRADRAPGAGAAARRARRAPRGISLFIVPKLLVGADGEPASETASRAASIEHKMGIRGSATCVLALRRARSASWWASRTPAWRRCSR